MRRLLLGIALGCSRHTSAARRRRYLPDAVGDPDRSVLPAGGRPTSPAGCRPTSSRCALGQQFVVENVVGAGGTTGVTRGARALAGRLHAHRSATWARTLPRSRNIPTSPTSRSRISSRSAWSPNIRWCSYQEGFSGEYAAGIRRLCEANEAKLNMAHARPRLGLAHRLPTAQRGDRDQADDGSVHRHGSGHERDARRAGGLRVRSDLGPLGMCAPAP